MLNCANCKYAVAHEGTRARCAINPPKAMLVPAQGLSGPTLQIVSYWPEVTPQDGCGQGVMRQNDANLQPSSIAIEA